MRGNARGSAANTAGRHVTTGAAQHPRRLPPRFANQQAALSNAGSRSPQGTRANDKISTPGLIILPTLKYISNVRQSYCARY